jgi:oxygen-independent coproporphyrinogen III oxidase
LTQVIGIRRDLGHSPAMGRAIIDPLTEAPGGVVFDADLVRRYDGRGPRYTSYPTANLMQSEFPAATYENIARESNHEPIPAPLSLYVHIPFCTSPCFYCGCTKIITRDRSHSGPYLERLSREFELQAELFDDDREVVQLHFGGGTPTFLDAEQMRGVLDSMGEHFQLSGRADREFSIEIDPRSVDREYVADLVDMGFSRMSLGVQDFDPLVQQKVNRLQPEELTLEAMGAAREAGVEGLSVDLIYGLPLQNAKRFSRTLDRITLCRPDRIALYSYAHMPKLFKPQKQIKEQDLPSAAEKLRILEMSIERLTDAGYVYIGMDHFALKDDELAVAQREGTLHRNFQGYSTHAGCDLVGFGMSSISSVGDCYAQNAKLLGLWEAALDAGRLPIEKGLVLGADDRIRRDLIQELMCQGRVDLKALGDRHRVDAAGYLGPELHRLEPLMDDGLVVPWDAGFQVTPKGRLLLRAIAMIFDAHLDGGVERFSKVI